MSDQGWQNALLQELGVPRAGLVTAANPTGPTGAPPPPSPAAYQPQPAPPQPQPQAPQPTPPAPPVRPDALPPEAVPVLAQPPQQAPEVAAPVAPAPPVPVPDPPPPVADPPPMPEPPPPPMPLSAPAPAAAQTYENGRQPPAQVEVGADLAHPDLAFPDLAHPSLGLSNAEASFEVQTDQSVQEAWRQQTGGQPSQPVAAPQPDQQQAPAPPQPAPPGPGMYTDELLRNKRHGDPLMRRVGRGLSKAVGATAGQDARENADLAGRIRLPVPTCRRIAVTSIRGGAGKTTVAGLTATVLTQIRGDRVLTADADSGLGSLPLRMGVQPALSLQDLARARPRSWDEAARFLAQSSDGLWVLSNTSGGRIGAELDLDTFRLASGEMSRYFSAILIDCGAGLLPELQRGILAEAHAQVLVTPATVDGALSARGALDWMAGNGYGALLPRTIVTLVTHTPHEDADLERAQHMLSAGGMTVVHVPYDRHLAGGTPIELSLTGEAAQNAATRIAAEAFARAASV